MRVRLTPQEKVEPLLERQRTKRWRAGEIIATQGHVRGNQGVSMGRDPAFAGGLLTVLWRMPILRHDVCGRSGDALGGPRPNTHRGMRRMVGQRLPVGAWTGETVLTREGYGRKGLRAIKGDSQWLV